MSLDIHSIIIDLPLPRNETKLFIDNEVDNLLRGEQCTICKLIFITREEKDNAICSGKKPLTFAHNDCWNMKMSE